MNVTYMSPDWNPVGPWFWLVVALAVFALVKFLFAAHGYASEADRTNRAVRDQAARDRRKWG